MDRTPTPQAPSPTGRVSVGVIGALLFLSGLLLGRWSGSAAPSIQPEGLAPQIASMEHSLDALRGEVERLRVSISTSLREPTSARSLSPDREPAGGEPAVDAAVQRLEQVIHELDRLRMPEGGRWKSPSPGRPSLADIKGEFDLRGSTDVERDSLTKDLTRAHLLWTVDDLVERYGMPRRVDGLGTSNLTVVYPFDGDTREYPKPYARFLVSQGFVIYAAIEPD